MKLTTLRSLFMARAPLPIPYPCGSSKSDCADIQASILRLASQKKLAFRDLAQNPIRIHQSEDGTCEALLVSFEFDFYQLPMYIFFRGYGTSRIHALKDLYDSMLENQ